jgi:hypothetical protein
MNEVNAAQSRVDQCTDLVRKTSTNGLVSSLETLSDEERRRHVNLKLLLEDIDKPIQRMAIQLTQIEDLLDSK